MGKTAPEQLGLEMHPIAELAACDGEMTVNKQKLPWIEVENFPLRMGGSTDWRLVLDVHGKMLESAPQLMSNVRQAIVDPDFEV